MRGLKKITAIIGRLFLSTIFILSAISKIFSWQKSESSLINLFCDWQSYTHSMAAISKMVSSFITFVPEILIIATAMELVGGLLLFFGIKERFGAFLLIMFFIPATFFLHPFWFMSGAKRSYEMVVLLKNIAMLGGLFLFLVFGSKIENHIIPTEVNYDDDQMGPEG